MQWTLVATTVALACAGVTWVADVNGHGAAPRGDFEPRRVDVWTYSGEGADARRKETLRRASFALDVAVANPVISDLSTDLPTCRFVSDPPSGTSAKFDCVFDGGELVKVKYGRNPEIHAERAATRLLDMLGYPADLVTIVPRIRCYGCPRFPFLATHLEYTLSLPVLPDRSDEGYTDFEWVSVEQKFPAPAIETEGHRGWSWWELKDSAAPRADLDALRLTAVFLAHWDNKEQNQRLVCLDGSARGPDAECARPVAMMQDLGATFGPSKVNLARWQALPVWKDRPSCRVSMAALPFEGATFPDAHISEAGRAQLASRLAAISDADVERLFREARFPEFQAGTADARDLRAWVAAFRDRAEQITSARCPAGT